MDARRRAPIRLPTIIELLIALLFAQVGLAQEDPKLDTPAQKEAPTAFASQKPAPVLHWGMGEGQSFGVPMKSPVTSCC